MKCFVIIQMRETPQHRKAAEGNTLYKIHHARPVRQAAVDDAKEMQSMHPNDMFIVRGVEIR